MRQNHPASASTSPPPQPWPGTLNTTSEPDPTHPCIATYLARSACRASRSASIRARRAASRRFSLSPSSPPAPPPRASAPHPRGRGRRGRLARRGGRLPRVARRRVAGAVGQRRDYWQPRCTGGPACNGGPAGAWNQPNPPARPVSTAADGPHRPPLKRTAGDRRRGTRSREPANAGAGHPPTAHKRHRRHHGRTVRPAAADPPRRWWVAKGAHGEGGVTEGDDGTTAGRTPFRQGQR